MRQRRTEPVTERLTGRPLGEEGVEVARDLVVEFLLGGGERFPGGDHFGDVHRELVKATARARVVESIGPVRRVGRRAGTPHLVGLADVIARAAQQQRIGGNAVVPVGAAQDCAEMRPEKILAREQRASARRAGGSGDVRVLEEYPLAREPVEVRRLDQVVQRARPVHLRVATGVTAPIVGEKEQDVRPFGLGAGSGEDEGAGEQRGGEPARREQEAVHGPSVSKTRYGATTTVRPSGGSHRPCTNRSRKIS